MNRPPARGRVAVAAAALLLLAGGLPSVLPAADAPPVCEVCGRPIQGRYVEVDGRSYHPDCWEAHAAPRCEVCGKAIRDQRVEADGKSYHPDCYRRKVLPRCAVCGKPIEGEYRVEGKRAYHPACHRVQARRCAVCGEALTGSFLDDGWGHPFHARHGTDLLCPYCNRLMVPAVTGGRRFDRAAGATVCTRCLKVAVRDRHDAARGMERARRRLADLFPVPEGGFQWDLADRDRLLSLMPAKPGPGHELGITLSEELRGGGRRTRRIEVHLLVGLPPWLLEAVAAHELAHVWQHQNGLGDLPADQAEGSAELAAYLVLSASSVPEAAIKIKAMRASPDPAYGAGFRRALAISREGRDPERLRAVLRGGRGWAKGT